MESVCTNTPRVIADLGAEHFLNHIGPHHNHKAWLLLYGPPSLFGHREAAPEVQKKGVFRALRTMGKQAPRNGARGPEKGGFEGSGNPLKNKGNI